jgi:glutathione peroxidase
MVSRKAGSYKDGQTSFSHEKSFLKKATKMTSLQSIQVDRIDGTHTTLAAFEGRVILVVNVASKCGLTPQYAALEKLYETYASRGLEIAGFPANDFGAQEPGTNEEIQSFCSTSYNVTFPMFSKISVKGPEQHPLYKALIHAQPTAQTPQGSNFKAKLESYGKTFDNPMDVMWNFEKFLVDKSGTVIARFSPDTTPDDPILIAAIEKALA